jgi:hypothetical protein
VVVGSFEYRDWCRCVSGEGWRDCRLSRRSDGATYYIVLVQIDPANTLSIAPSLRREREIRSLSPLPHQPNDRHHRRDHRQRNHNICPSYGHGVRTLNFFLCKAQYGALPACEPPKRYYHECRIVVGTLVATVAAGGFNLMPTIIRR